MKGMLDFLEKAGLVKKDSSGDQVQPGRQVTGSEAQDFELATPTANTKPVATAGQGLTMDLDEIYANGRIAPSLYPAERLLRLVDGLSAMDEATRLMAIKAMDAADESWSIEDPLADAAAKVEALAAYAEQRRLSLLALQAESQTRLQALEARQAQVVGDIRKQITELEALVSRELTRAAHETATQEATLKAAQDKTAQELDEISRISQQLQGLAQQFDIPTPQD